ncbi:MAG: FAD-binding oxidoreductase [Chitinophagaceae bacterium]|nr:FAD-binding oxidoreductase [Chitinophagaceae bacterium]
MMGGIISNNASGMCCGVAQNSYHTLKHIRFMLPDGRVYDTRISGEEEKFEKECPELATVLKTRKQQIMADEKLLHTIRHKYQIKNTVGYALNAFVDYGTPLSIFAHLLVGAEGTLAFISEAELETVPDYPFKATGLLFFDDIFAACKAIQPFSELGARAIELMDRSALRSVEHIAGIPAIIQTLPPSAAALLIEFQGESEMDVATQLIKVPYLFPHLALLEQPVFSQDPAVQALYWKVRKGLFPSVGAVRASGTTVILEDVAVPVAHLGNAISDLQGLFLQYGYPNAIIFGHARDGNIHFVVTQAFDTEKEIERYDRFIRDVVNIIVNKYNGSLKAEHGTGRNMAPFVKNRMGRRPVPDYERN